MIYTFIFSEGDRCANKNVERKAPKRCTFSPDDPNTIFSEKKRNKAKAFIQQRKSHYEELLCGMIMARIASVCPLTFWGVSITY